METPVFQNREWNDLIFENRNKEYGAYVLRMEHERNMVAGLLFALGFMATAFLLGIISVKYLSEPKVPYVPPTIVNPNEYTFPKLKVKEKVQPTASAPPKVKTEKLTNQIEITHNTHETIATQEKLSNSNVGSQTITEGNETGLETGLKDVKDANASVLEKTEDAKIYDQTNVELMPMFPGGEAEMYKYLYSHIKYTAEARERNIQGMVFLSFVIDETGRPVNVRVIRGLCCGLNEEAIKAFEAMPLWNPGKMGNKAVKVAYSLSVSFKLK